MNGGTVYFHLVQALSPPLVCTCTSVDCAHVVAVAAGMRTQRRRPVLSGVPFWH